MKSNNTDLAKDMASLADTLKILKQNAYNKNTKQITYSHCNIVRLIPRCLYIYHV